MTAVALIVTTVASVIFIVSGAAAPAYASQASQVGDSAAAIALSQLGPNYSAGNVENPMGSGCNKYTGALYGGSSGCASGYGNKGDYGFAWCSDFATWVWQQAGANVSGLTSAAYSFYTYGVAHGTWHAYGSGYTPQPGDAIVYGISGTYAAHVGIVTDSTPDVVQGNWWYNYPDSPQEWGVAWDPGGVDVGAAPAGYVTPVPANSGTSGGSGSVLGSSCLGFHLGPDGTTPQIDCIPAGTTVTIDCWLSGQSVTGPYGAETTWDHTSYNGQAGFVSDAWIYTGSNNPVAGPCGGNGVAMVQGCLTMRAGPYQASAAVGCIAQAASFTIDCTATGDSVSGPYGASSLWDHTSYSGASGYVPDAYVYTGTANAVAGTCAPTVAPPQINQGSLPRGITGQHYSQQFTVTGGTSPYTFSVAAASLPPGLALSSGGDLSGTPTKAGAYSFTVSVTDSEGPAAVTTQQGVTLTILAPVKVTSASVLHTAVGAPYRATLTARGGTKPYAWSLVAGRLPAGLILSKAGVLSGKPTRAGSFTFTLRVTDSSKPALTARTAFTVQVAPIAVKTASLPKATVGKAYKVTLAAYGGKAPLRWRISKGHLPHGLTLSSSGVLSGKPTVKGKFTFTVTVTDAARHSASRSLTLTVS